MQIPGRQIHWFESIDSTMHEAARLASAGCPSGTVVGADRQTAGIGRQGRSWHSETAAGLYVSVVLRLESAAMPSVMLALGLAVSRAITRVTGLKPDLRWPNDVLISGKKAAGILADLSDGAVIAGIGLNVNQTEMPGDIRDLATSLRIESGREWDRERVLAAMLDAIDEETSRDAHSIVAAFRAASTYAEGKHVIVDRPEQRLEGITAGLDPDGFLLIRTKDGRTERVVSGGVRPLEPQCS